MLEFSALNNVDETWFQRCTSNQKSINVLNLNQLVTVLFAHTTTINDSAIGCLFVDALQVSSDPVVDLVDLLSCCCLASSNRPHRFVSQNHILPVGYFILDCVKLSFNNFDCSVLFSFGKSFSKTEDDFHAMFQTVLYLFGDNSVGLSEMSSSLGVTQDYPLNVNVQKLFRSDFSSIGTKCIGWAILSSNINIGLFFCEQDSHQMKINWSNNDILK